MFNKVKVLMNKLFEYSDKRWGTKFAKPVERTLVVSPEVSALVDDYFKNPELWDIKNDVGFGEIILKRGNAIEIRLQATASYRRGGSKEKQIPLEDSYLGYWWRPTHPTMQLRKDDVVALLAIKDVVQGDTARKQEQEKIKKQIEFTDAIFSTLATPGSVQAKKKITVLVDMDGVLADYYAGFLKIWTDRYPDRKVVPASQLTSFYLEDSYPAEWIDEILAITRGKGFFRNLPPIEGAVQALKEMDESGLYEIYLCTAPDVDAEDQCCPGEKLQWVEEVLGKKWLKRTIMSTDKSLVMGDIIIDDKPEMKKSVTPTWKRVFFTHAYNQTMAGPRITKWSDWKRVLDSVK